MSPCTGEGKLADALEGGWPYPWQVSTCGAGALMCSYVYFLLTVKRKKNESFQVVHLQTKDFKQWGSLVWNDGTSTWFTWCGSSGEPCSHFMICMCWDSEQKQINQNLSPERVWVEGRGQPCAEGSIPVAWMKYKTRLYWVREIGVGTKRVPLYPPPQLWEQLSLLSEYTWGEPSSLLLPLTSR